MGVNLDLHGKVFTISSVVVLLFVILTLALQDTIAPIYDGVFGFLTGNLAWFFILGGQHFRHSVYRPDFSLHWGVKSVSVGPTQTDFTYMGWFRCCSRQAWALA